MNICRYWFCYVFLSLAVIASCSRDFDPITGNKQPGEDRPELSNYTEISGTILDTLRFSDSPYYVSGNLRVDSLTTLTINPGVRLYFDQEKSLVVHGTLNARGSKGNPILFSALTDSWEGIRVESPAEEFVFHYCTVEKVDLGQDNSDGYGALAVFSGNVEIRYSVFRSNTANYGGGLSLRSATGFVTNNIFCQNTTNAFGGAMLIYQSDMNIHNNTLLDNYSINYGGGILLFDAGGSSIQNNIF